MNRRSESVFRTSARRMLIRVGSCNNTSELLPAGSPRARWCSRTTFQRVSGSQVKNAICALRLISSSDTVRPQNKASRIGCTLWTSRARQAGNEFEFALPPLKREFLLFVWQKKTRSRLSEEGLCHGAQYCKGFHSPASRFP